MKTSNTKRALAFWLAIAMLTTGVPAAFAAQSNTAVTLENSSQPDGGGSGEASSTQTIESVTIKNGENPLADNTVHVDGTKITTDGSAEIKQNELKAEATLSGAQQETAQAQQTDINWSVEEPQGAGKQDVVVNGNGTTATITVSPKAKAGEYKIKASVAGGTATTTNTAETAKNIAVLKVVRDGEDKAATVEITGASEITIPVQDDKTEQFQATIKNAFEEEVSGTPTVTWSVTPEKKDEYSIEPESSDSKKGILTVKSNAQAGDIKVKATCQEISSSEKQVALKQEESQLKEITEIWATVDGKKENATNGLTLENSKSATFSVKGKDQYGKDMEVTNGVTASVKDNSSDIISANGATITAKSAGTKAVEVKVGEIKKETNVTVRPTSTENYTIKITDGIQSGSKFEYGNTIPDPKVTITNSEGTVEPAPGTVRFEYREVGESESTLASTEKPKNMGKYEVIAYYDSGDVHAASEPIPFEITKRRIVVKPDNKTIRQGENIPTLTFTITEGTLISGDTNDDLGVKLMAENAATIPSAGTYKIIKDGEPTPKKEYYNVIVEEGSTLTVTNSVLTIESVEQISGTWDDNYPFFSVSLRDTNINGYTRVYADANDYLEAQRINGRTSEWIGMVIKPKNGNAISANNLYVSTDTGATKTWTALTSNMSLGDFYIDRAGGETFELWYDTDDRDCSKSLYLATDSKGGNLFELKIDFDSYSRGSSGGGGSGSGSTSSDTSKVDGEKVSTTKVNKTPSVKNGSAEVSFTSSKLSDALKENKREANREKADKTFIQLDVKTSRSVDDTTITIPRKSLDEIADEDTGLKLNTNHGVFTLDDRALSSIYSNSSKSDIDFYIEEDKDEYTLKIKDGSSDIIDLGSGDAQITFDYKLKSGEKSSDVKVYRIGDGKNTWLSANDTVYGGTGTYAAATGNYVTDMKADYSSSKKQVTFNTDALGTFLVTTETLTNTNPNPNPGYSRFLDVPPSRWSAGYIEKLASLGIVNGTGGGYFQPTLYVTREEFVAMLARMDGVNVSSYYNSRFPDISPSRWSAPYIEWAASRGITTGTDGGRFAPEMGITREEMATMIYRYTQSAGKTLPQQKPPVIFADAARISPWAQVPVSTMQQAGIIDGNVYNGIYTFDPQLPATREECAKMLAILYDMI